MLTTVSSDNPAIVITDMTNVSQTSNLPAPPVPSSMAPQITSNQEFNSGPTTITSTLPPGTGVVQDVEKTTKSVKRSALSNLCCVTCCGPKLPKVKTDVAAPVTKTKETIETATNVVTNPVVAPQVPFSTNIGSSDEAAGLSSGSSDVSPHSDEQGVDDETSSGGSSSSDTPSLEPKPVPETPKPSPLGAWYNKFRKAKPE